MRVPRPVLVGLAVGALLLGACTKESDTVIVQQLGPVTPPPTPPPFALTGITPGGGPAAGGTAVQVAGTGIAAGATVRFGSTAATSVTWLAATTLVAVSPAGTGTVSVTVQNPDGATRTLTNAFTYTAVPVVTHSLGANFTALVGDDVQFTVTATKAGAAALDLGLVAPPPGCIATPVRGATSPATLTVRWRVPSQCGGRQQIFVRAVEPATGAAVLASVPVQVIGRVGDVGIVVADVTGDGVLDAVVGAQGADGGGFAVDTGAVYVWAGQTAPSGAPTATLRVPGAVAGDQLGLGSGQSIQCCDVTGDGIDDVVATGYRAAVAGVVHAGAVYVWAGGAGLTGSLAPTATCRAASPQPGDQVGYGSGQAVRCCDVTGDGTLDIVAAAWLADVGGVTDAGAVYVWAGGPGLTGAVTPTATCAAASPAAGDGLGSVVWGQGLLCHDVTGDGTLDVIAGASLADVGGVANAGRIYVWAGGSGLTGALAPTAVLGLTSPTANDGLGNLGVNAGTGLQCAEVTGDTTLDVIAGGYLVDAGAGDSGAVYVWAGGSGLTGSVAPTASCVLASPAASTQLGWCNGQGIQCREVTGDSTLDLVVGAAGASEGATGSGAVYVWAGGSGLTGTVNPTAKCVVSAPTAYDGVGNFQGGRALLCAEVTGDTTLDIVAGGAFVDTTVLNAGAVYVWAGGSGLTGSVTPTASLLGPAGTFGGQMGWAGFLAGADPLCCGDVTGDGVAEIVVTGIQTNPIGITSSGGVYIWKGGSGLTGTPSPLATLVDSGASAGDRLGNGTGPGVQLADVTGDGIADAVVTATDADLGPTVNAGAVYVWAGGSGLSGAPAPTATLLGVYSAGDALGSAGGHAVQVADVTGDGTLDVVAAAMSADVSGVVDAGAVLVWAGGSGLTGTPTATAALAGGRAGGVTCGGLGAAWGQGVVLADCTGDGIPDVLGGAPASATPAGAGAGAVYAWAGGASLSGAPAPTATWTDPNAFAGDALGN